MRRRSYLDIFFLVSISFIKRTMTAPCPYPSYMLVPFGGGFISVSSPKTKQTKKTKTRQLQEGGGVQGKNYSRKVHNVEYIHVRNVRGPLSRWYGETREKLLCSCASLTNDLKRDSDQSSTTNCCLATDRQATQNLFRRVPPCLLYTSPSPRDS